jgi:hypothetical protein
MDLFHFFVFNGRGCYRRTNLSTVWLDTEHKDSESYMQAYY